jgi:hypothetical protein
MKPQLRFLVALAAVALGLGAVSAAPASPPDSRFRVTYARIAQGNAGPYLIVRVKGPTRTVRIRVTQLDRRHRVLRVAIRTIRTNRRVRVPRLAIAHLTSIVRVRIVGHIA